MKAKVVPFLVFPAVTDDFFFFEQLMYHNIMLPNLSLEDSCGTHDIRFSGSHQDNWDYIVSDHCVLGTMSQVI